MTLGSPGSAGWSPQNTNGGVMSVSMDLEAHYCAHNYHPLPVVLTRGEGVFAWDESGKKYLDMMRAYSAVSHGHAHPQLDGLVREQSAACFLKFIMRPKEFSYA